MAEQTKIQWCDHTASPWYGCAHVHAGCTNCYAEALAKRNPSTLGVWGPSGTRVKSKSFIANLHKWNRAAAVAGQIVSVFPSLCDPFEDRPELEPWRLEMFKEVDRCPNIRLMLLTKRPENIRRMWPEKSFDLSGWNGTLAGYWYDREWKLYRPNVWLLTSISDQATADRMIPPLLECRDLCPVLGVSAEPLLGPVDLEHIVLRQNGELPNALSDSLGDWIAPLHGAFIDSPRLDWVIIGGESGPNARPCNLDWIRSLVGQCRNAGVAAFVKQVGSFPLGPWNDRLADSKGGDMAEWPADLRVREFPNG